MKTEINRQKDTSHLVSVEHNFEEIEAQKALTLQRLAGQVKIPGFRDGKAPLGKIEEQLDRNHFHQEIINDLISHSYPEILKETALKPIANPRVEVKKWVPYTELSYELNIAERPVAKLGDYKKAFRKAREGKKAEEEFSQEDVLEALISVTESEIPHLLLHEEADRMIMRLVEHLQQIGMSVEQYLQGKGKDHQGLREEYELAAKRTLLAELALSEIIKERGIAVSEEEIASAIAANPDENARKFLEKEENKWYIESVLAKQKALESLMSDPE